MPSNQNCLLAGTSEATDGMELFKVLKTHDHLSGRPSFDKRLYACGACGLRETVVFPVGNINPGSDGIGVAIDAEGECIDPQAAEYTRIITGKYSQTNPLA